MHLLAFLSVFSGGIYSSIPAYRLSVLLCQVFDWARNSRVVAEVNRGTREMRHVISTSVGEMYVRFKVVGRHPHCWILIAAWWARLICRPRDLRKERDTIRWATQANQTLHSPMASSSKGERESGRQCGKVAQMYAYVLQFVCGFG